MTFPLPDGFQVVQALRDWGGVSFTSREGAPGLPYRLFMNGPIMRLVPRDNKTSTLTLFAPAYTATGTAASKRGVVGLRSNACLNEMLLIEFQPEEKSQQFQEFFYVQLSIFEPFARNFPAALLTCEGEMNCLLPKRDKPRTCFVRIEPSGGKFIFRAKKKTHKKAKEPDFLVELSGLTTVSTCLRLSKQFHSQHPHMHSKSSTSASSAATASSSQSHPASTSQCVGFC
jgi:hypothetical protein